MASGAPQGFLAGPASSPITSSCPAWGAGRAELGWHVASAFPTGFLEKNRDVLSTDILALVHSSENKFLREIFNLESAETKLGRGTILKAKARNLLFKVGSVTALPGPPGSGRP